MSAFLQQQALVQVTVDESKDCFFVVSASTTLLQNVSTRCEAALDMTASGWMQSLNFCAQMTADEHSIHCKVL